MGIADFEIGATIWLVEAWELRKRKGADWCRKKKVGMVRLALSNPPRERPDAVITDTGLRRTADIYASTLCLLKLHCTACGACDWREEKAVVMPAHPMRRE